LGQVKITVSVDWDADCSYARFVDSLENEIGVFNLEAAKIVKAPVPMTHFICPAFYVREPKLSKDYTEVINRYLRPIDEVGLHIHCWKTFVEAALGSGTYLNVPSVFTDGEPPQKHDGVADRGQGIPLGAYQTEQIEAMLLYGNKLLSALALDKTANDGSITSFRCGAWMTNDRVFDALAKAGFRHEASAVACSLLQDNQALAPMAQLLKQLWREDTTHLNPAAVMNKWRRSVYPEGVVPTSQPRVVAGLVEVPNTGVLAEYTDADHMTQHVSDAAGALDDLPGYGVQDLYVSLGFHHNNPSGFPRLLEALERIVAACGKKVAFITTREVPAIQRVLRLRGG
jgi:hypothetical protein